MDVTDIFLHFFLTNFRILVPNRPLKKLWSPQTPCSNPCSPRNLLDRYFGSAVTEVAEVADAQRNDDAPEMGSGTGGAGGFGSGVFFG